MRRRLQPDQGDRASINGEVLPKLCTSGGLDSLGCVWGAQWTTLGGGGRLGLFPDAAEKAHGHGGGDEED